MHIDCSLCAFIRFWMNPLVLNEWDQWISPTFVVFTSLTWDCVGDILQTYILAGDSYITLFTMSRLRSEIITNKFNF
jgi:hypothetical protein